ncbi:MULTISPECIES: hypothetical protein [unclassified Micromonospora]|uniref:DUF3885 domain-containing protein n=1 Tax=unclassified Micromonospora TaxID=2617518 RepID=UPI00098D2FB2|nr:MULTISPECIES: hypothetical protein [unclassified Micromonospora]MDI5937357.1 hypothetical protein [Micromonospora sp. DH15]OON28187.1 hypothetical protein BSA16_28130 [Micromonospora sp. Rc5]
MTSSHELKPPALTALWEQHWPECPPFAHRLRGQYPDQWVRFHSLPESKRYPDNESEYAIVLDRHYTVLSELAPGAVLLVVTSEWTEGPRLTPQMWPRRSEIAPFAWYWRTLLEHPEEEPECRSYTQLYADTILWRPGAIDVLLRAVADDELANVILAPTDLRWLYLPYDGGADVVLPTREQRDALKAQHRDWLSQQSSGF